MNRSKSAPDGKLLGDADLVMSRGILNSAEAAGERKDPVDFEFYRISVHRRIPEGEFREIYQGSDIGYRPMTWIFLPNPIVGRKGRWDLTWRMEARAQSDLPSGRTISWPVVLVDLFDIDLTQEDADRHARAVALFERISFEGRVPSPSEWAFFREYLRKRSIWSYKDEDRLAARILRDPRFPRRKSFTRQSIWS